MKKTPKKSVLNNVFGSLAGLFNRPILSSTTGPKETFASRFVWTSWLTIILGLCVVSWAYFYSIGLITTYNDAMSHLNLSRLVFDNLQPGLSQIGGVWLPLTHLLPLALIWNDWAWHSGFAASFFSMVSYLVSCWAIYKMIAEITANQPKANLSKKIRFNVPAALGTLAFATNLNVLYLQATPLTEMMYLVFFVLSAYVFVKWVKNESPIQLLTLGVLGFCQVLTRYDGWFVVGIEGLLILAHLVINRPNKIKSWKTFIGHSLGKLFLFGFPVAFGVALWLGWNLLIFGDPLYFALGPYSAHAQQSAHEHNVGLITKHNWWVSTVAYYYASAANVGVYALILGALGAVFFVLRKLQLLSINKKILILAFLFAPIFFNILALYLGFSILNMPELGWNPSKDSSGQWFNVRYGIMALPFFAVGVGLLGLWKKLYVPLIIAGLIMQQVLLYQAGIITVIDGTKGSSSFANHDVANELKRVMKPDQKVLMSTSFFNAVAFESGMELDQLIHEGTGETWKYAVSNPELYADYIVMPNGDVGEAIYTELVENQKNRFRGVYKQIFKGRHTMIFARKSEDELFVRREQDRLTVGTRNFEIKGVNSFELAYRTEEEIQQTFDQLQLMGVTTVRFWLFGDGNDDGFQPKAGIINEDRFKKSDYIIAAARQHNIKLVPVLVNNWEDYGGKNQYLTWTGKSTTKEEQEFYINQDIKGLYKNYVNKVLSRTNTITGTKYAEEPAILAWDLMNEPRLEFGDKNFVIQWTKEMSEYVKQNDSNHLVMIGTEKIMADPATSEVSKLCELESIDICSVHLYFYHDGDAQYQTHSQVDSMLDTQIKAGKAFQKPTMIGEVGIEKDFRPFGESPIEVLSKTTQQAKALGYNGALIWNYSQRPDASFGFAPRTFGNQFYTTETLNQILNHN